jgi:Fe-S oxidoreductase
VLASVALVATVLGVGLFARGTVDVVRRLRHGAASPGRLRPVRRRLTTALREIGTHARFRARPVAREAHWFVMMSFVLLVPTLGTAYAEVLDPLAELPVIGGWAPWQWLLEIVSWAGLAGIGALVVLRLRYGTDSTDAAGARAWRSRFFGSTRWQAWFVEAVIAIVIGCVLSMRAMQSALLRQDPATAAAGGWQHFPLTGWWGDALLAVPAGTLGSAIAVVATVKIVVSMTWLGVVGLGATMSVAWHRFLGVVNVYARRQADGGTALGAAAPMLVDGTPFDLRELDDLPDDAALGIGTIDEFGWKALLDFASCTECGRCQDVCPAWNTGQPLSPKLFTLTLRDHAAAAGRPAPAGDGSAGERRAPGPADLHSADLLSALTSAGALGTPGADGALVPGAITTDVLWACTMCGACVEACPVDIEHLDHLLDLRRHQVMSVSQFPTELGGMFRNLDTTGNPWGLPPRGRLEWTRGLDFPVNVVGQQVRSLAEVDYLLWVGCAGCYDTQGRATTRAVAELLHRAGVTFAVLGEAETCSGDPARRAGNEATFQALALQNIETFTGLGVSRIIVTCAHCLNTLAKEYPAFGGRYQVAHHTQVLNQLVRAGRLTLAAPPPEERHPITYHDPCYLGRHDGEYDAPRELLSALPDVTLVEMAHQRSTSLCCGGGGGRMWSEDIAGTPISAARLAEATAVGATTVATACPFCTVMLGEAAATARSGQQVRDVAHLVLEGVRRADAG